MTELGIVDIREIIKAIKSICNYDFSNYALTSFKQRLERLMKLNSIDSGDGLIRKLQNDPDFMDLFLFEITVSSTEMFRDPSLWRWLREEFFTNAIQRNIGRYKIWLPQCVSGGELYSLVILLSEMGLLDKVQIIATCFSDKSIEFIKNGYYDLKKLDVSEENYRRFNGLHELSFYYKTDRNYAIRNTSLLDGVEFKKLNINFDNSPQNNKLILFRNSLIYFNPTQQDRIINSLFQSLSGSGYMVLGIRERISGISTSREFELVNETESVYRKKT
jgi:chemotaxis protein methyltransferase CheR